MTNCYSMRSLLVFGSLVALPLLAGCVSTDPNGLGIFMPVKDIEANPAQYLQTEFAVAGIPRSVASAINAADAGSLPFRKMTFSTLVTYANGSKSVKTEAQVLMYVSAGGPFVQIFHEFRSNTIPVSQAYSLSYRGVLNIRWQFIPLNLTSVAKPTELKSLQAAISWPDNGSGAGALDFTGTEGWIPQVMNFRSSSEHCTFGDSYPAAAVYGTLAGEARAVDCSETNANGVVSIRWSGVWLKRYGVVVGLHVRTAAADVDTKIMGVTLEGAAPGAGLRPAGKQTV